MFKRFGLIIILILVLAFIVACGSDGQTNGETEEPTIQATAVETDLVEGVLPAKESIEEVSCIQNPELCMVIDEDTPLCPIFPTLDGQAYNARDVEDGDLLATVLDLSHGEVVFNTIIDGMAPMGFTPASIDFSLDPENAVIILVLDNFKKPSATDSPDLLPMDALYQDVSHIGSILVAGVDIGDFEIKQLSQRIQDAITNLPTVQKYVINMSFALVPCNEALRLTLAAYLTGDDDETNFDNLQMILEDLIEFTYVLGTPELADRIAQVSKPIMAFSNGMIASAAYWIASATGGIYTTRTANTGSIGVYMAIADESRAFEAQGVKIEVIKAGKLKAMGFPGTPITDQAREHLQAQVNQIYSMFTNHVRQYRGDDIESSAMQGQLFMGPEAVEAGLIDGVVRNKAEALERFLG
jgi:hypothetical protein